MLWWPSPQLLSNVIVGKLDYAYFLQCLKAATESFFPMEDNEDFYFRVNTPSLETNYAPQLPKQRCPAVCNKQPRQEVLEYSGEALPKQNLKAAAYFPLADLQQSLAEGKCGEICPSSAWNFILAFWKDRRIFWGESVVKALTVI